MPHKKSRRSTREKPTTEAGQADEGKQVHVEPVYPCPRCYPKLGGVAKVTHTLPESVYCRCKVCEWTWCTTRKQGEMFYGRRVEE